MAFVRCDRYYLQAEGVRRRHTAALKLTCFIGELLREHACRKAWAAPSPTTTHLVVAYRMTVSLQEIAELREWLQPR